jgi:hypothetical protein
VYAIAAQAALLAGILAAPTGAPSWAFGVASLFVGVVGALVARRIELTGWLDREQLDVFEAEIAKGRPDLLLHHGDSFRQRLTRRGGLQSSQRTIAHRIDLKLTRFVPPGAVLAGLMLILGITGLLAGIAQSDRPAVDESRPRVTIVVTPMASPRAGPASTEKPAQHK